jgi:hypothetical protein
MPKTFCFSAAAVVSGSPGIRTLGMSDLRNGTPLLFWKMTLNTSAEIAQQLPSIVIAAL